MKQSLGEFISTLRKANGYTQADVAEKLNVSNRTLSSWETDRTAPDVSVLPALADLYGVTVDEILRCERQIKDDGEKRLSQTAEISMRKNRFAKFCGKRILCLGLGLLSAALFVTGCGLIYANNCPLWLDVLLMVLGGGGNAACLILLSFFYYSSLRQEGLVFESDYTQEKQAYVLTVRNKFAKTYAINSLPYILCSIIILILFSALGLDKVYVGVGGMNIILDYTTPTVVVVILSGIIGLSALIFALAYNAVGFKKFADENQRKTAAFNRKTARKVYGIAAIPVGVIFVAAIIFLLVPINIENVEFRCNDYDDFVAHMHTLVIDDDADDLYGKIPHGSYKLLFPTNITLETNYSEEYDLGNGFSGCCYATTYWSDGASLTCLEWRIDYQGDYYCWVPTLKCDIAQTQQTFAAVPYKEWSGDMFAAEKNVDQHFEVRCKDGFEIVHVTTLSELKYGVSMATTYGLITTYITVCTFIYFLKHKKIEYGF